MKFLDLIPCSCGNDLSPLQGVDLELLNHLLFFEISNALLSESRLRLNVEQMLLDLVKVIKCHCELIEVLG